MRLSSSGLAIAGFFPGIVLYLTYWFPSHRRAKMVALIMTGNPLSGIIGGPLSGAIMRFFNGSHGVAGWQWLFLLEAIPALILGIIVFFVFDDRVTHATWLTAEEKSFVASEIDAEASRQMPATPSPLQPFLSPRLWLAWPPSTSAS